MIKPIDIESRTFTKAISGYNMKEVDDFLQRISESVDDTIKENMQLRANIRAYDDELKRFREIEESLKNALLLASEASEEALRNAREKAKVIQEEAELRAKSLLDDSNNELYRMKVKLDTIREEYEMFRSRFKSLLESELRNLESKVD